MPAHTPAPIRHALVSLHHGDPIPHQLRGILTGRGLLDRDGLTPAGQDATRDALDRFRAAEAHTMRERVRARR